MSAGAAFKSPGFPAFFVTQFLGAFNDNLFKNAVVILISATQARVFGVPPAMMITLCSAIFVLPFFTFSAWAGQLADRYDKTQIIRYVKLAEIAIMVLVAVGFMLPSLEVLFLGIFLMGTHSSVLGPVKYSILPQLVGPNALVAANAQVEGGTFLAILIGTIGGGILVLLPNGKPLVSVMLGVIAVAGYGTSRLIPALPPASPDMQVTFRFAKPTMDILRITKRVRAVFLSVLGISWFWLVGAMFLSLLPTYARDTLRADEHVVTLFLTLFCLGIGVGSLLCERISGPNLELGLVPLGSLGMTIFAADLGLSSPLIEASQPLVGAAEFLARPGSIRVAVDLFMIALFGGLFTVPLYTLIQQRAPAPERSRVIAGNNILNSLFMVVGSILLAVAQGAGMPTARTFVGIAVLNLVVGIYIYSLLPEFMLRLVAWFFGKVMYRLKVEGHERIPQEGPVVLVCNHQSFIDWLVIAGNIRRPIRFVMDHRIAATPIVSLLFRQAKAIPIAPAREDKETMERAFAKVREELADDQLVCIFPEGKVTRDGLMSEFRPGIDRILKESPVPVVPLSLDGLWGSVFSREGTGLLKKLPKRFRAKVSLKVGEPMSPSEANAPALEEQVRALLGHA